METLIEKPITLRFTEIWNNSVSLEDRELKERDYCWASELYHSMVDRYLAMKATPKTNPPNVRSRRKFFAGNVWEFIAGVVLQQLGIVINKQEEIWVNDAPLRVKGKLDYLIGGVPNYDKARDYINSLPFQDKMKVRFMKVIDLFEKEIGNNEIALMVHEIKSCSEYVIDKLAEGGNILGHDLQIYHYLRGLNLSEGHIDYISKNDALMAERVIKYPDNQLKERYDRDLATLKGYLESNTQPPPEPLISFEGKFVKSFSVEYSNYLTLVYGFKEPEDYRNEVAGKISSWNRTLKRIKDVDEGKTTPTGKPIKLTDKNLASIDEMNQNGFDVHKLAKEAKITEEEDES